MGTASWCLTPATSGVMLRAVLFVDAVAGVAAMFGTGSFLDWLARLSLVTGGALPATLAWLIVACSLKKPLSRLAALAAVLGGGGPGGGGRLVWMRSAGAGRVRGTRRPGPPARFQARCWRPAGGRIGVARQGPHAGRTAARLTELQSRIRPHFLFNTSTRPLRWCARNRREAEAMLEDLSDLFRHALVDQGESVTLAEEIALARRYLDDRTGALWRAGCGSSGRLRHSRRPQRCRRCCCSRWWKTP